MTTQTEALAQPERTWKGQIDNDAFFKSVESQPEQEPDDALFRHRVRVHLANRNFYSHREFCEKLEALMHETQPKQEPVAFIDMREWPPIRWRDGMVRADVAPFDGQGLFFAPPQRKPLTDEQRYALIEKHLGLKQRRDNTVIDQYTGLFYSAQPYFDLINEAAHGIKGDA